jgi:hypothetical protein
MLWAHRIRTTSGAYGRSCGNRGRGGVELFGSPFAFFHPGTAREERLAAYIVREHRRGRALADILDDRYLRSRCSHSQLGLLLEHPTLISLLADDVADERQRISRANGSA